MIAPSIDPRRQDAALRPQPSRDGADYWPTPASLIGALIAHVLPTLPAGPRVGMCRRRRQARSRNA
jgi:hypothetical protein